MHTLYMSTLKFSHKEIDILNFPIKSYKSSHITGLHDLILNHHIITVLVLFTSAKSIFLRLVSKVRKQRAVEPPLETRNSTFEIFDRACHGQIDHYCDDMVMNKPILGNVDYYGNMGTSNAVLPLKFPIHL